MEKLKGPFKNILPLFIKMKKSCGYDYKNISNYIELDNYLYINNITEIKNLKELFFVAVTNEKSDKKKRQRYNCLRQLNQFMKDNNLGELYIEEIYVKRINNFEPTILTTKQIIEFFNTVDNEASKRSDNGKYIYPVLFRLIYSCGLRISEALSLKKTQYNGENKTILIVESKNKTSRIIPLSQSMENIMDKYITISSNFNKTGNLFDIKYSTVKAFFDIIVNIMSLSPCRIHDLRHTFAVNAMDKIIKIYGENQALILLQFYLGHQDVSSTEYYLRLTKHHYKLIKNNMQKTNDKIYSKVGDIYE